MRKHPNFFWLHIKKAGGTSFRETFSPPYVLTKRTRNSKPFIALPKEEWNDALNNYRIPLGEYDFKRMLFAKKFLYDSSEFDRMFKFAIVRNPYARAVSAWKYLMKNRIVIKPRKLAMKHSLVHFLKEVPNMWKEKYDRHLATHTAPMWKDLTDEHGDLLVDKVIKLEEFQDYIDLLNDRLDLDIEELIHINKSGTDKSYRKYYNNKSKKLVESLYRDDINKLDYSF